MNKQILINKLVTLGLEQDSAYIYLHLLEDGPKTILEISRNLSIERAKIYRHAKILTDLGLVNESHIAWGKKIQASDPSILEALVAKKSIELDKYKQTVDDLISPLGIIQKTNKTNFKVKNYYGQEGIRQMLWNSLRSHTDIIAFSFLNRNDMVGRNFAEKIRAEQVKRGIRIYELENNRDSGDYEFSYTDIKGWSDIYASKVIDEKLFVIRQHIVIFNQTVSIINWINGEETGVEIENNYFCEMQRQIFWQLWKIGTDIIGSDIS